MRDYTTWLADKFAEISYELAAADVALAAEVGRTEQQRKRADAAEESARELAAQVESLAKAAEGYRAERDECNRLRNDEREAAAFLRRQLAEAQLVTDVVREDTEEGYRVVKLVNDGAELYEFVYEPSGKNTLIFAPDGYKFLVVRRPDAAYAAEEQQA